MQIALDELLIDGIKSNIPLQRDLVRDPEFQKGGIKSTTWKKNLTLN